MEHKILQALAELATTAEFGAVSPEAVATYARIDLATFAPAVPALQKQGLIAVDDDFGMLSLTDLGKAKLAVKDPGL